MRRWCYWRSPFTLLEDCTYVCQANILKCSSPHYRARYVNLTVKTVRINLDLHIGHLGGMEVGECIILCPFTELLVPTASQVSDQSGGLAQEVELEERGVVHLANPLLEEVGSSKTFLITFEK